MSALPRGGATVPSSHACQWCGKPLRDFRRVTCSHPVCRRKSNAQKAESKPPPRFSLEKLRAIKESPDTKSRTAILRGMQENQERGHGYAEAVFLTARAVGQPVAVVMSAYKSQGGQPWNR